MNVDYDNYKPKRPVDFESILIIPPSLNSIKKFKDNETYKILNKTII